MLQYDDQGFHFFLLSSISFYLLPSWYYIISSVISAVKVKDEAIGAVTRTSEEKKKTAEIKKESSGLTRLKTRKFLINSAITVLLTILFVWLFMSVSSDGEVQSFDPFAILEIDSGADAKTIKKAYRSLSLKFHPDKNPNNRAAEAKFMMVSKAYEALTDETAKENWEKYGNPDGKQSLEVSIGLPSFLLDSNYRNLVLIAYLITMVGVIPFLVYKYYSDSSKYGEKDVMYATYSWYHFCLGDHTLLKQMPEILAGSAEFRNRNKPKTQAEKEAIARWVAALRQQMPKPKHNNAVCLKGNALMHAHLLRKADTILDEKGKDDLKYMLRQSSSLVEAMISVCKNQQSIESVCNCIEFMQSITQAVWNKESELLQMPHFTSEEIKHVLNSKKPCKTVAQYRKQEPSQRKGMVHFTNEQKADVEAFLKIFPDISVKTKVFVDDDEDDNVYEGDLCTIQVSIERNTIEKYGKADAVHAPRFPFAKRESWWVVLGQLKEGKILSVDNVTDQGQTIVHKIKFMAPPAGNYEFDLLVKSNAYVGCDYQTKIEMNALDNSALPEFKVHPDDAELDDEPTLFEEMLNAHVEQDSDDEEDDSDSDDDDDDGDDKINDAAAKKKAALRRARQGDDDDSDSDSEAEEVYADK